MPVVTTTVRVSLQSFKASLSQHGFPRCDYTDSNSACHALYLLCSVRAEGLVEAHAAKTSSVVMVSSCSLRVRIYVCVHVCMHVCESVCMCVFVSA